MEKQVKQEKRMTAVHLTPEAGKKIKLIAFDDRTTVSVAIEKLILKEYAEREKNGKII